MTKRSLLTRLYLIILLAAPLYWLILTDEGRRYTDLAILKMKGGETMELQLMALHSSITERRLQQQLPDTPFHCGPQATPFGDRLCQVQLASFNGLPARFAIAYFAGNQLQGLKIGYQRPYHTHLLGHLVTTLGPAGPAGHLTPSDGPGLYQWRVGDGLLLALDENSLEGNEPSLLWKRQ
jgi:hypothetical protein